MKKTNWVVVGGCARSGTTMLVQLLNTNFNIYLTNEQNLQNTFWKLKSIFDREKFVLSAGEREKNPKENWTNNDILKDTLREDKALFPALSLIYENSLKPDEEFRIFGDKLPFYWRDRFEVFREKLNIKIVHISRHPYDVVHSYLQRAKNSNNGTDKWKKNINIYEVCNEWIESWNYATANSNKDYFFALKV